MLTVPSRRVRPSRGLGHLFALPWGHLLNVTRELGVSHLSGWYFQRVIWDGMRAVSRWKVVRSWCSRLLRLSRWHLLEGRGRRLPPLRRPSFHPWYREQCVLLLREESIPCVDPRGAREYKYVCPCCPSTALRGLRRSVMRGRKDGGRLGGAVSGGAEGRQREEHLLSARLLQEWHRVCRNVRGIPGTYGLLRTEPRSKSHVRTVRSRLYRGLRTVHHL